MIKNLNNKHVYILCVLLTITVPGLILVTPYSSEASAALGKAMVSIFASLVLTTHIYMKDHKKIPSFSTICSLLIISIIVYWIVTLSYTFIVVGKNALNYFLMQITENFLGFLYISLKRMIPSLLYFSFILNKHFQYLNLSNEPDPTSWPEDDGELNEVDTMKTNRSEDDGELNEVDTMKTNRSEDDGELNEVDTMKTKKSGFGWGKIIWTILTIGIIVGWGIRLIEKF